MSSPGTGASTAKRQVAPSETMRDFGETLAKSGVGGVPSDSTIRVTVTSAARCAHGHGSAATCAASASPQAR